jgi:hypothetical protein
MTLDEWQACEDPGTMLDFLRGKVDPMKVRRFACICVRRIWGQVISQKHVSPEAVVHCCRAVELTEQSLVNSVPEADIQAIDFHGITDNGDEAFMAAAHVGWNLFAPFTDLPTVDEFDHAKETAFLAACAGDSFERKRQSTLLRELLP